MEAVAIGNQLKTFLQLDRSCEIRIDSKTKFLKEILKRAESMTLTKIMTTKGLDKFPAVFFFLQKFFGYLKRASACSKHENKPILRENKKADKT